MNVHIYTCTTQETTNFNKARVALASFTRQSVCTSVNHAHSYKTGPTHLMDELHGVLEDWHESRETEVSYLQHDGVRVHLKTPAASENSNM